MTDTDIKNKIPDGWSRNKLSYFVDLIGKRAPKFSTPYLEIGDIDIISKNYELKEKPAPGVCLLAESGDVLVSKVRPTRGAITFVKDSLFTSPAFSVVRSKKNKQYLFYALSRQKFVNYLGIRETGTTYPSCDDGDILDYKADFPEDSTEQQKIAEVLATVDEAIEKTNAIIEKNKRIKQGLMQDLFRYGIDEHGNIRSEKTHKFKTVKIGNEEMRIPEDWDAVKLSEIANVVDSLHTTPLFVEDGVPMVRGTDIKEGDLILDKAFKVTFGIFKLYSKKYLPKKEDILMTRVGSYGVVTYVNTDSKFCLGQNTVVIVPQDANSKYLYHFLTFQVIKEQIENGLAGSSQKTLSLKNIRNLVLTLPKNKKEQEGIANRIVGLEDVEKIEIKNKQKLLSLKRGLMEDLLTGTVRVNSLITK
jgi:type I restriction enzyme S subunit